MNMRKLTGKAAILAAGICVAAVLPSWAAAKSVTLTLSGYEGTTTLTNFQALVKLTEGRHGFSYNDYAAKDGSYLWFTDSSGNVIPHELDTWDASGDSFVWVRVPEVSGTDTKIVMHWGVAKTAAQTATENVWKNYNDGKGGFAGVWHMNVNLDDEPDVTGNGLSAARNGGNIGQMTVNADAVVGWSRVNQTVSFGSTKGNGLKVSGYGNYITDAAHFTLCGWFRASSTPTAYFRLFWCPSKWDVYHNSTTYDTISIGRAISIGGTNIADPVPDKLPSNENFLDNWCYVVVVFDGTSYRLYGNGRVLGSWTGKPSVDGFADYFLIGNNSSNNRGWYGRYDEVRMYDGAQSMDRVRADYATMKSPETFIIIDTMPVTATWIGTAADGNVMNAANWDCRNVSGDRLYDTLPTSDTAVSISGASLYINASTNVSLVCREVNIGDSSLGADCDLRGLTPLTFTAGTSMDMNGHTLKVMTISGAGAITNSVAGDAVDLYAYGAPGVTNVNNSVRIGGNIRFVKDGKGGFFTSKEHQPYTGGTLVKEGELRCGTYGTRTPFGTGDITIDPDGIMDMNGWMGYAYNDFILNGGTLKNTRAQVSANDWNWALWGTVRLTADSTILIANSYGFRGQNSGAATLDLGGHTLTLIPSVNQHFMLVNTTILNGKILGMGGGYLHTYNSSKSDIGSETFDFVTTNTELNIERNMKVRDYVAAYKWDYNAGDAVIEVYGTFTPGAEHDYFHGCTMMAGSTIDLSSRTNALPLVSAFTDGAKTLAFTNGATVNVKLGGRKVARGEPIISWSAKPANIDTVKFKPALGERACSFVKKDDGLYITRGFMLIVK